MMPLKDKTKNHPLTNNYTEQWTLNN